MITNLHEGRWMPGEHNNGASEAANRDEAPDAAEEACDAAEGMQKRQRKADQASGSNGI